MITSLYYLVSMASQCSVQAAPPSCISMGACVSCVLCMQYLHGCATYNCSIGAEARACTGMIHGVYAYAAQDCL